MQYLILYSLCVFLMFGCIAYGENDMKLDHSKEVARDGNLESRLVVNLFSSMQSDIRELRTEIREQQTKHEEELEELKIKHEAEISKLEAKIEDANIAKLKEEIEQLNEERKDKPRTVYAQIQLLGENTLTAGARVKFTGTIANIGEAYKTAQGYFEAPYDGTYLFTVSLCMGVGSWVEFRIVHDSNILSEGFPGDSAWHSCASATAATYMRTGSKVWVDLDRVHGGMTISHAGIPSFTGVFINNFKKP